MLILPELAYFILVMGVVSLLKEDGKSSFWVLAAGLVLYVAHRAVIRCGGGCHHPRWRYNTHGELACKVCGKVADYWDELKNS